MKFINYNFLKKVIGGCNPKNLDDVYEIDFAEMRITKYPGLKKARFFSNN